MVCLKSKCLTKNLNFDLLIFRAYRRDRVYTNAPTETVRRTTYTNDPYGSPNSYDYGRPRLTNDVGPQYGSTDLNPNRDRGNFYN